MKFARINRSRLAWMLFAFVLFNGLACSFGHGQMLGAFFHGSDADDCGMPQSAMAAMPEMAGTTLAKAIKAPLAMKHMDNACSFAGTMALALVFFIALGWLCRVGCGHPPQPVSRYRRPPRHALPGLHPHAP